MAPRLHFLGGTGSVTGSRYLVETDASKVLVDCGLYQERQHRDRNWNPFAIPPKSIDAVVLTHAHLDHCGLLPKLVKDGFRGTVFCTPATAEAAAIVMRDAAHIQEEDAKYKRKRHRREGRSDSRPAAPLYTQEDAEKAESLFETVELEHPVTVAKSVAAEFRCAGHILGSSSVRLTAEAPGGTRRILFSGDVGRADRPILRDPAPPFEADYVQIESTYGDRLHPPEEDIQKRLAAIVLETLKRGGNLIIPTFAIERAQEVLYRLALLKYAKIIPHLTVFLDSPMAIRVVEVFRRHPEIYDENLKRLLMEGRSPFAFDGLTLSRTTEQSKAINHIRGTSIILAGSGMCTGGRVKHHLVHNIERPESTVLFVGYQASGTLGRRIVEGEASVRILGRERPVRARVEQIHGFSGHADRDELVAWLRSIPSPPQRIFVTHGGENVSRRFADHIEAQTGWPAEAPAFGASVELA